MLNIKKNSNSVVEDYKLDFGFNFCGCGFKKDDYFIRLAEKCYIDCNLFIDCGKCRKFEKRTLISLKFKIVDHVFISEIFSPLKLFYLTNTIFEKFQNLENFFLVEAELRNKIILNLLFYCRNYGINCSFLLYYLKI